MLTKLPSADKINVAKNRLLFLLRDPTHHGFTFNWFVSLKGCVGFSIFDSVSFLLKFLFLFSKKHGLFDSFQN